MTKNVRLLSETFSTQKAGFYLGLFKTVIDETNNLSKRTNEQNLHNKSRWRLVWTMEEILLFIALQLIMESTSSLLKFLMCRVFTTLFSILKININQVLIATLLQMLQRVGKSLKKGIHLFTFQKKSLVYYCFSTK